MTIATILAQIALFGWFFGCICTYKIGKRVLVEGMGLKSAEFVMLCLFVIGCLIFWLAPVVGRWLLLAVLAFWFVVQFFCHWYYTIFGASKKKLQGYNSCFKNTVRIFPASETKLIPDLYHIVLHLLILTNVAFVICSLVLQGN